MFTFRSVMDVTFHHVILVFFLNELKNHIIFLKERERLIHPICRSVHRIYSSCFLTCFLANKYLIERVEEYR
jgi:hypothetical protein